MIGLLAFIGVLWLAWQGVGFVNGFCQAAAVAAIRREAHGKEQMDRRSRALALAEQRSSRVGGGRC